MEISDVELRRRSNTRPSLACERCARRKIKCDRAFPACRTCLKAAGNCSYPIASRKPGPKPGAPQRRRQRADVVPPRPDGLISLAPFADSGIQSPRHEDQEVALSSIPGAAPNTQPERSPSRGLALSQLVHPSHEPVQNSSIEPLSEDASLGRKNDSTINEVCKSLHISTETYRYLLHSYFENMTAFSLFHRPSFESKLLAISSHLQLQALVAAVSSFSARYHDTTPGNLAPSNIPPPEHFRKIAAQSVEEALKQCDDDVPPLCLLQALILITFDELISGVRGRAWRSVGHCVRIAYELQLHLVDKDLSNTSPRNNPIDLLVEEKRRAWWVIWEFDVFASTIRRLPTAIDWMLNATCLPVEDNVWFANDYAKSCHLDPDPCFAWKSLQESGNHSPKAWFIVVNALMRSAHVLSYPQAYPNSTRSQRPGVGENVQAGLDILSNSLYCLTVALPPRLAYQGEYLAFSKSSGGLESLQLDCARHNIHFMIQLSRFMINHYQVFDSTSRQLGSANNSSQINQSTPTFNQSAWNHYLAAASEVVALVRSCSPRHVNYVNPFLASTIWLAAAAQIVSKHIGQSLVDRRVADSNLDLLQTNLNASVSTWGVSSALQEKLISLKTRLDSFGEHIINSGQRESRVGEQTSESVPPAPETRTEGLRGNEMRRNGTDANASNGISQQIGPSTNDWSFQQGLDIAGPEFEPVMGLDLWGWGLDELAIAQNTTGWLIS